MIIDPQTILSLLHRMAWRFTRDYHNAEDLAQVTLIKAWLGWQPEMAAWDDRRLYGWLRAIMKNAWFTTLHKLSSHSASELDRTIATTESIEDDTVTRMAVEETLARLIPRYRTILVLCGQGQSREEIAEANGEEVDAIYDRLYRAKQAFKREWATVAA